MEGGHGYTPQQVGDMTLDEIFMALADRKMLTKRRKIFDPLQAAQLADKDGLLKGRAADGTPIVGRVAGKSKARQLMDAKAAREASVKRGRRDRRNRKK